MKKEDWSIAVGGLLLILALAGIVQDTTPGQAPLSAGLTVLVLFAFLLGLGFLFYGTSVSLSSHTRARRPTSV